MGTVARLRERFPRLRDPPARHLLCHPEPAGRGQGDGAGLRLVIVVGSRNSSGTPVRRWSRWRWSAGADAAYLVDYAEDIDPVCSTA